MNRNMGLAAMRQRQAAAAAAAESNAASAAQLEADLKAHALKFQEDLRVFAEKYRKQIAKDAAFRAQFYEMCRTAGVDPLLSSRSTFAKLFGSTQNQYFYDIGVQVLDVCTVTEPLNGGIIALNDLCERLHSMRGRSDVSIADIKTAVNVLKPLGGNLSFVTDDAGNEYLRSVSSDASPDQLSVLRVLAEDGGKSFAQIRSKLGWDPLRTRKAIDGLLTCGQALIDDGAENDRLFWALAAA